MALFNEYLGRLASLTCLCSADNELSPASYEIDNRLPVGKSQVLNPLCWIKIYRKAKKINATHLILEFPYYGIAGVLCKKLLGVKLIVHSHNIEGLRFKEQRKWWWRILFFFEKHVSQRADLVFVKTATDKSEAVTHFALDKNKVLVIPYASNGNKMLNKQQARQIICKRHHIKEEEKIFLFAGTLDYLPNAEAVLAIYDTIVPLLKKENIPFTFLICGRNKLREFAYLNNFSNENVIYAGEVKDIETYFACCDVFVNPVKKGGGVQTKIYDALSFHCNVVAFESMLQKDEQLLSLRKVHAVKDGDWPAFVRSIVNAMTNSEWVPAMFLKANSWAESAKKAIEHLKTAL